MNCVWCKSADGLVEHFGEPVCLDCGRIQPVTQAEPANKQSCCGQPMSQIYNAANQLTRGWWCQHCNAFDAAIFREKKLPLAI